MADFRNTCTFIICNFLIEHLAVEPYRSYLRTVWYLGEKEFGREFWSRYDAEQEEKEI